MFRVLTNIMCELRFSPDYLVHPLLNFRNKSESMFPFQYTEPKLGAVENFARGGVKYSHEVEFPCNIL